MEEIEKLITEYQFWLRDKTTLKEVGDSWIEITTPFLDRHNDSLQLYARPSNGGYVISDDSYTIHDLESSGCSLKSDKRRDLLQMTLNGFGVKLEKDALQVHATRDNFPLKKHSLMQAMLAVNDLFFLAQPVIESLFWEDVVAWLEQMEVRFTPGAKFTGTSGYDHLFDFVIPKSRDQPERILQAINRPTRDTAETFIYKWSDTRAVRPRDSKAYAILNDAQMPISSSVMDAFTNYSIIPVPWSRRMEIQQEIAA